MRDQWKAQPYIFFFIPLSKVVFWIMRILSYFATTWSHFCIPTDGPMRSVNNGPFLITHKYISADIVLRETALSGGDGCPFEVIFFSNSLEAHGGLTVWNGKVFETVGRLLSQNTPILYKVERMK